MLSSLSLGTFESIATSESEVLEGVATLVKEIRIAMCFRSNPPWAEKCARLVFVLGKSSLHVCARRSTAAGGLPEAARSQLRIPSAAI